MRPQGINKRTTDFGGGPQDEVVNVVVVHLARNPNLRVKNTMGIVDLPYVRVSSPEEAVRR